MILTYLHAILHLRPGAQVALVGGTSYAHIQWGAEAPIAQADLDTALAAAQAAHDAALAAAAAERSAQQALRTDAKATAMFATLAGATLAEIDAWVDSNFATLTVAQRRLLKLLAASSSLYLRERGT